MGLVSHLDDPGLSVWQYGLGRVAAWTSDALGLWTARWLQWSQAAQWWANLVTWTLPTPDSSMNINGKVVNGIAQIAVDLPPGTPAQGQQQVQAHIIAPDLSQGTITLQPTASAHWEGSFAASQVGAYLLQVTWRGPATNAQNGSQLTATTGLVVPYSPEFSSGGVDLHFLQLLAHAGGGTLLNPADSASAFTQNLLPVSSAIPITFLLLALAALLLPVDIAVRRLSSLEFLALGWRWLLSRVGIGRANIATQTTQRPSSPIIAPLGNIRAKRQERRERTTPAGPVQGIARTTPQAKSVSPAQEIHAPQQQELSDTPSVSTTETLLAAKRKRQ